MLDKRTVFAAALLKLNQQKSLQQISVADLLAETKAGKATFYRYFHNKNDLIRYVYLNHIKIEDDFPMYQDDDLSCRTESFSRLYLHRDFMKQACALSGAYCLKDFLITHAYERHFARLIDLYHEETSIPKDLLFSIRFASYGSKLMLIDWIMNDCPISPEDFARQITANYPEIIRDLIRGKQG